MRVIHFNTDGHGQERQFTAGLSFRMGTVKNSKNIENDWLIL